jgi:signal transduction histidine kinase
MRPLLRLRWQLTLSHLVAIAFTLLSMIAAIVLVVSAWTSWQSGREREPRPEARAVARAVAGVVVDLVGSPPGAPTRAERATELDVILRSLVGGRLRLLDARAAYAPEEARWAESAGFSLRDLRYAVVLRPDGSVLASSDPSGPGFAPPERVEWPPLLAAALGPAVPGAPGGRPAAGRPVPGPVEPGSPEGTSRPPADPATSPLVLAAAPVLGPDGQPLAAVIVAAAPAAAAGPSGFWHSLVFFGAALAAILAVAFLFALVPSSLLGYLLSRRLTGRLERLGQVAAALAAGDLSRRVEEGPPDELGQLAGRFNRMAADLETTLRDLRAERDRVGGLLEARRQLVAAVSHELRTPVATVRGYLDSALHRADPLPLDLRGDLETMEHELARLERLIEDLFTLARVEVGRLALRLEPTDVGGLVQRLSDTLGPLAWTQRRVQLLAEVAPALPLARADGERLEQVVGNLIANAVRHTPPGGLVAAAVAAEDGVVRVDVRDTGEGIAADELPRVFERFYRAAGPEGARGDGAGLGLALVKELAEAMGGSVAAESVPGQGSCFTVRLPRD